MQDYGNSGGTTGGGCEVDKEGGVVEGPGEEKDLCRGTFTFCGSDDGGYGFEIVLEIRHELFVLGGKEV